MDRHVFLAALPWLHAVVDAALPAASASAAASAAGGAAPASASSAEEQAQQEEELLAALGYEFKADRLFSGLCCLHLLPLPGGAVVTPASLFLFFDGGEADTAPADPAQLRLHLWVITHLLHRATSLCGVLDGRPFQIDHTQCEMLQTFGHGEVNGRPTPAFIRMSFGALALQLWYPDSGASASEADAATRGATAAADEAQHSTEATPAMGGGSSAGSEGEDAQRLEEVGRLLTEAVANKPFAPRRPPPEAATSPTAAGAGACDASRALHARLLAAERQRTALLQALQSMVAAQPGAAAGAVDGAEVGATEAERLRAVSDAIAKLSDTRLSPAEVAAGLAELEQRDQLREADSASPPEWAGEEDTHADASLWRREEESRMLLEMSQGEEGEDR